MLIYNSKGPITADELTLSEHAERGLLYLVCKSVSHSVSQSVCLSITVEVKKTFPKTFTVQPFTVYPFPPKRRSTVRPLTVTIALRNPRWARKTPATIEL